MMKRLLIYLPPIMSLLLLLRLRYRCCLRHVSAFQGAAHTVIVRARTYRGGGQDAGRCGDGILRAEGPAEDGRVFGEESECRTSMGSAVARK